MKPVVYILRSLKTDRYYIGSTNNMERRSAEHNNRQVTATKYILPLEILFTQSFSDIKTARQIECRLKKMKNKKIIDSIIEEGRIRFVE